MIKKWALAAFVLTNLLAFSNCKKNTGGGTTPSVSAPILSDSAALKSGVLVAAKVVFVNIDTLQANYAWFKQTKSALEQKEKSLAQSLDQKAQSFQQEYVALQQEAQKGTVPPAQLEQKSRALQQKQQSIVAERESRSKALLEETQKGNETLQNRLAAVLADMQKTKGFDYVVSYQKGGGAFLFVNPSLDVTNEVVAVLNAQKN